MSPRVVRCLALTALLFPAAVLLSPVRAQVGPPPGFGGMPGGGQGGIAGGGMPGGFQGGFQGGMAGQPGGIAGGIGGGAMDEWTCSGCGAVIGHGPVKPAWMHCPRCGAQFSDGPGDLDPGPPPRQNNPPPPAKNNSTSSGNRTALTVVASVVGILVVLGGLGAVLYFVFARSTAQKEAPRRRPRRSIPRRTKISEFPPEE